MKIVNYVLACLLTLAFAVNAAMGAEVLHDANDTAKAFAQGKPMVVMFHATWCGFCKKAMPEYLKAEKAFEGKVNFYLVDIDESAKGILPTIEVRAHIGGIPAFIAGTDEKQVTSGNSVFEGYMDAEQIKGYVRAHTGIEPTK